MIQKTFVSFIEDGIKNSWHAPALTDYKGESFTYANVATEILRLHAMFQQMNIQPGDKIALIGKNTARWAIVYFATTSYGCTIVPILPEFKPDDLQQLVNHSDSIALFCEDAIFSKFENFMMPQLLASFSLTDFSNLHSANAHYDNLYQQFASIVAEEKKFQLPCISNDALAVISYTSGTTGSVKGVMLLHNCLAANVDFAVNHLKLTIGDRICSFLPFAHAFGCAFELLYPFASGCHITILTKTPTPQLIMQAFAEVKPSLILSVPLVIEKIYKKKILPLLESTKMKILLSIPGLNTLIYKKINQKISSVFGGEFKMIIIGGASFNKDAEAFFKKIKLKFCVGYGMTECGPLISYTNWRAFKPTSSGRVIPSLEMKIDSADAKNIVGEIMVKGENVMVGYYKNEELSQEIIEKDGWMHTGDLGTMDDDGTVYIKGRSKTMLLGSNGKNIYPDEIEAVLNNMTAVGESLVIQRGDKLIALIHPDAEYVKAHNWTEENIQKQFKQNLQYLNNKIPAFMHVANFELQKEEFIKTPKKSIKRYLYL